MRPRGPGNEDAPPPNHLVPVFSCEKALNIKNINKTRRPRSRLYMTHMTYIYVYDPNIYRSAVIRIKNVTTGACTIQHEVLNDFYE